MGTLRLDDETIAQLFTTLIWQAPHDPPLDSLGYTRADIPADDQAPLVEQFRGFCEVMTDDIEEFMAHTGRDMTDVAHDFILTANRHGTGFWDRCYCGNDDAAQRLTDAAHPAGDIDLDRADDGTLFLTI